MSSTQMPLAISFIATTGAVFLRYGSITMRSSAMDRLRRRAKPIARSRDGPVEGLRDWAKANKELFPTPTADEGAFIARIFAVRHFQQVIEQKKLLKGGKNADPFIVARAAVIGGTVVTMEKEPKKGAKNSEYLSALRNSVRFSRRVHGS